MAVGELGLWMTSSPPDAYLQGVVGRSPVGLVHAVYSRLREMAMSGLTMDTTYRGQIMAPWHRNSTVSPSVASNETDWLE